MSKFCEYCEKERVAYTFMTGETICNECLISMPTSTYGLRMDLYRSRSRVRDLEAENERIKKLYKDWGYADAPCSKHSKDAILIENNCASCRAEKAEAELNRLKAYVSVLEANEKLAVAEIKSLRASHAALVDAATMVTSEAKHFDYCSKIGWDRLLKLKSALAGEVE